MENGRVRKCDDREFSAVSVRLADDFGVTLDCLLGRTEE